MERQMENEMDLNACRGYAKSRDTGNCLGPHSSAVDFCPDTLFMWDLQAFDPACAHTQLRKMTLTTPSRSFSKVSGQKVMHSGLRANHYFSVSREGPSS